MAKRVLSATQAEKAFTVVIGLSSQLRDYRLVHQINRNREIPFSFIRYEDLKGRTAGDAEPAFFSLFLCQDEEAYFTCYLVSNRTSDGVLIPGLKEMDYLLLIDGSFGNQQKDDLLKTLRSEPGILMASEVNVTGIKPFAAFVDDLEFHMMDQKT